MGNSKKMEGGLFHIRNFHAHENIKKTVSVFIEIYISYPLKTNIHPLSMFLNE